MRAEDLAHAAGADGLHQDVRTDEKARSAALEKLRALKISQPLALHQVFGNQKRVGEVGRDLVC